MNINVSIKKKHNYVNFLSGFKTRKEVIVLCVKSGSLL